MNSRYWKLRPSFTPPVSDAAGAVPSTQLWSSAVNYKVTGMFTGSLDRSVSPSGYLSYL